MKVFFVGIVLIFVCSFSKGSPDELKGNDTDTIKKVIELIDSPKKHSDSIQAFLQIEKALLLVTNSGNQKAIGDVQTQYADLYTNYGNLKKAIYHYKQAEKNYLKAGAKEALVYVYMQMGRKIYEQGDYSKALDIYLIGLKICDELKLKNENTAWLLSYIGSVYKRHDESEKALGYYFKALVIFNKTGNKDADGIASCLNNIGNAYGDIGKDSMQLFYYKKALELSEKNGLKSRAAVITDNIASTYFTRGGYDTALMYYNKTRQYLNEMKRINHSQVAYNLSKTAEVFIAKKDYSTAFEYIKDAENHLSRTEEKHTLYLLDIYSNYIKIYEATGDISHAYSYYKKHNELNDSLIKADVNLKLSQMEMMNELEKEEQKNAQLSQEEELKTQRLSTQRNWIMFLILGLTAILIFSTMLFIQKRKLSMAYHDLFEKNLEIVTAENHNGKLSNAHPTEDKPENKYTASSLSDLEKLKLKERIVHSFEINQVYLQSDLTVVKLATELNTNSAYLSQVINELFDKNFSSFVNEYRVKEARKMLSDPKFQHLTIEAIAKNTGFNSLSAFNNSFKKFTGITPSYYLKSVRDFFE